MNKSNKVKNAEWSKLDVTNIFNQFFVPNDCALIIVGFSTQSL